MTGIREIACYFGAARQLSGVLSEPGDRRPMPGFVLITAGLTPKYGPYRLYARLARRAAAAGMVALRFDLGGVGDSLPEDRSLPLRERTRREISAALDELSERYGLREFILCGLCSGAEDALRHALEDPRVRGVAAIDPFSFRTAGFAWRHLAYRIRRRILLQLGIYEPLPDVQARSREGARLVQYQYLQRDEARHLATTVTRRGGRLHFVYTGGSRETFNHRGQLWKMLGGDIERSAVTMDYFPRVEHTQEVEDDRQRVIDSVGRWLDSFVA